MKPGKLYSTTVMAVLTLGIIGYLAIYIVQSLYDPFTTTTAYNYTMQDSVEVEGMLIRDEYLLPTESQIFDVTRREGERVGVGQTVAYRYRDATTQGDQTDLDRVKNEIEVMRRVLEGEGDILSAATQDEAILQSIIALRSAAATQRLGALDEEVVALKSQVLERDYAYSQSLTEEMLVERLAQLVAKERSLSASTESGVQAIYTPTAGLFSANVDGFETVLTPAALETLTLEDLSQAMATTPTEDPTAVGKIILGEKFYLAVAAPSQLAREVVVGDSLTVYFDGEFRGETTMKVTRIGEETDDERLFVLESDRFVSDTTLLRTTTVKIVYGVTEGIRVPKISMRTETTTDKDGNVTTRFGVYTVMAGKAEFHPVDPLIQGEDFYVVAPLETGSGRLRAGDEVIVHATGLYDGKPLNE